MPKRYNPPPNWPPPPEGWTPPKDWKPDAAWGPPPPGWHLWVDEPQTGKRRAWLWPVIAAGTFLLGLLFGATAAAGGDTTTAAGGESEPGATITVTQDVAGPVVTETVTAKPPQPEDVIEEGTWAVGQDVRPGMYKIIEPIAGDCYWEITRLGNPGDIIDNDLPTGGRPTVTLRKGQEFTNQGCGVWGRQ